MNCVIYVRVSTEEQAKEGFSIAAQKERLRAFALSQGWTITEEYIEEGWSAKNIERPQLQKLLKDIIKNKTEVVLVYRLDRLTRSVLDLYQLLKTFDENNIAFRSATEVYDTSTAMGRLFITLVAALAQWERENLGERVRFGVDQMLDEGKRAGSISNYGYKFDKDFNCEIIEKEAEAIRLMFDWYLEGYGYTSICKKLDVKGYKPRKSEAWNRSTIKKYLSNPIYVGDYIWGDRTLTNTHTPIVDRLTFEKVQLLKNQRTRKNRRHGKYLLTGLLKCGHCNHGMIGNIEKRNNDMAFYRCTKCSRTLVEYKIVDPLLDELEKLIASKEYFLSRMNDPEDQNELHLIQKELEKIKTQKNKLLDLYTDEEVLFDKEELYTRIKSLNSKEKDLQIKVSELDLDLETPEQKYEKIKFIKDIRLHFSKAPIDLKKELLQSIFKEIILYKEKTRSRYASVTIGYTLK